MKRIGWAIEFLKKDGKPFKRRQFLKWGDDPAVCESHVDVKYRIKTMSGMACSDNRWKTTPCRPVEVFIK